MDADVTIVSLIVAAAIALVVPLAFKHLFGKHVVFGAWVATGVYFLIPFLVGNFASRIVPENYRNPAKREKAGIVLDGSDGWEITIDVLMQMHQPLLLGYALTTVGFIVLGGVRDWTYVLGSIALFPILAAWALLVIALLGCGFYNLCL